MIIKNPTKISQSHFENLLKTKDILKIKRADCSTYNECAGKAERKSWPQFSCESCTGFTKATSQQQEHDCLSLLRLYCEINGGEHPELVSILG
jgi:hypothetical protein